MTNDPLALVLSFLYVSVILGLGEGLRRGLHLSVDFTRKFVHIGVGMISFALVVLFREWYFAIIPSLLPKPEFKRSVISSRNFSDKSWDVIFPSCSYTSIRSMMDTDRPETDSFH